MSRLTSKPAPNSSFARSCRWHRAFMLLVALLCSCQARQPTWERIQESGILRVGLDPTYPPFELAEGQSLAGLDVDLADAIARDLALATQYSYFGYDGLYDALATDQVDVLISALVIIPERTRDFAYTISYFDAGQILILPAGTTSITAMADLGGRSLAIELGAQGHVEATNWAKRLPALTVLTYDTTDAALDAVAAGTADAALVDSVSGRLYLMSHPELKRASQPVTLEPYALVVRIEDEGLLQKLNERLVHLRQSGELAEIISRWLGD